MVSVTPSGGAANGVSSEPVISADASAIAYYSTATNLVAGEDPNGVGMDVYMVDRETGRHTRASASSDGRTPIRGESFGPSLSRDGAVLAFASTASLEAPGCAPPDVSAAPGIRVYVRDNRRQTVVCIDVAPNQPARLRRSHSASVSPDGGFVAFVSETTSPIEHGGRAAQVYLYDLSRGITTLVSRTRTGSPANGDSLRPAVSAGGRFVVFESLASNLASERRCRGEAADLNLLPDIYLMDVEAGRARRLSTGGWPGEWWVPSVAPAIDGSGRIVAFSSRQPQSPDDVDTAFDLYVWAFEAAGP
jgi:Tol biopolymer transport system component